MILSHVTVFRVEGLLAPALYVNSLIYARVFKA